MREGGEAMDAIDAIRKTSEDRFGTVYPFAVQLDVLAVQLEDGSFAIDVNGKRAIWYGETGEIHVYEPDTEQWAETELSRARKSDRTAALMRDLAPVIGDAVRRIS